MTHCLYYNCLLFLEIIAILVTLGILVTHPIRTQILIMTSIALVNL